MLGFVCNGSICVCFVLTCIATNIKISTSLFDVNFYFVYFIAPIITSHIYRVTSVTLTGVMRLCGACLQGL